VQHHQRARSTQYIALPAQPLYILSRPGSQDFADSPEDPRSGVTRYPVFRVKTGILATQVVHDNGLIIDKRAVYLLRQSTFGIPGAPQGRS
jgi:hypothetical protein